MRLYWYDMKQTVVEVKVEKIIYGGQGLATLEDGKKLFVWGVLPDEVARVRITKNKKSWAEGIAEEILKPSEKRVGAKDPESYLSTSPWQILDYDYENKLKQELIVDQFTQHGVTLKLDDYTAPKEPYHYRNKVEFSFWWDNDTNQLDLAFFKRGTHTKQPVTGTSLARPEINTAATTILRKLRADNIEARNLKTLLIRCNQQGSVIAELYVKERSLKFDPTHQRLGIEGFSVHFSNPKSPASVKTETLFSSGATQLTDGIFGQKYTYGADGFFQVAPEMYETALKKMSEFIPHDTPLLDMYSGVGSIGLSLADKKQALTLVEVDERCVIEAKNNAANIKPNTEIVLASSESATEYITGQETVILDPPRAGLHQKVIDRLLETRPETILYLSCNPATQARDIALLTDTYYIVYAHGYNFFPKTPHIENLLILRAKSH